VAVFDLEDMRRVASQRVAIIDYGSGNLHSAHKAFERAARESDIACTIDVTRMPEQVASADRIVLPGVGAFGDCRRGLDEIGGMMAALDEAVVKRGRPFLGICVGMQLMATRGLEFGETAGFGWIEGDVSAITPSDPALKIPHMGWNTLDVVRPHAVLAGIPTGPQGLHAYFVHSFHLAAKQPDSVIARPDYGGPVTAVVGAANMVGTQFHPEKSQRLGLALIANFLAWAP
jgi:glutamine amidotransferase